MSDRNLKATIKPSIMKWARKSVGEDIEVVAKKLKVEIQEIINWESQESIIKISDLKKLAKIYKRPLAVFFLKENPKEKLPKDYRVLPKNKNKLLTKDTKIAIRKIQHFQSLAVELSELLNTKTKKLSIRINLDNNPENFAEQIRLKMNITLGQQFKLKNDSSALLFWKKKIEEMGILVYQMKAPIEEIRGLSLLDKKNPVIAINIKDAIRARIFTIFHEFCHILLNDDGFCDLGEEDYSSGHIKKIEKFCNHFAGAILVPKSALFEHPLIENIKNYDESSEKAIKRIANNFKVSREVILRRLLIFQKISKKYYEEKINEYKEEFKKIKKHRGKGRWLVPYKQSVQEKGITFTEMVLDARSKDLITLSDITNYLNVKIKHLLKVEEYLLNL